MNSSPLDDLVTWYSSLPLAHREDIAAFVVAATPGFEGLDPWTSADLVGEFLGAVHALRKTRYQEVGMALALRSSIEFFVIDRRSTREAWQEVASALEKAEWLGGPDVIAADRNDFHFRAEQWLETCATWKSMREVSLSDGKLNDFLDSHLTA